MIRHVHRYSREEIQANPDTLYVFGDNLAEAGYGGQGKEARGEPNAVGIPTKRAPSMEPDAFFTDADLPTVKPIAQAAYRRLLDHLKEGKTVVFPADGIGTGLALLHETAPAINDFLNACQRHLIKTYEAARERRI